MIFFYLYLFFVGTAIGSFLGVLIERLPNEETIFGRSHCDYCDRNLTAVDLVPVFSYFLLGGKCRKCHKKLSIKYPLLEIFTGVMFVVTWIFLNTIPPMIPNVMVDILNTLHTLFVSNAFINSMLGQIRLELLTNNSLLIDQFSLQSIAFKIMMLGIVSCLIVILFADLKYQIIPDSMQFFLFLFSLGAMIFQHLTFFGFLSHSISGIVILMPLLLLFILTRGRGMGFGDVKLAFTIGFLFGIVGGALVLYIGFVTGAVVGALLLLRKRKKMHSKIAFGPFLVLGMFAMLFFGNIITTYALKMYGF